MTTTKNIEKELEELEKRVAKLEKSKPSEWLKRLRPIRREDELNESLIIFDGTPQESREVFAQS